MQFSELYLVREPDDEEFQVIASGGDLPQALFTRLQDIPYGLRAKGDLVSVIKRGAEESVDYYEVVQCVEVITEDDDGPGIRHIVMVKPGNANTAVALRGVGAITAIEYKTAIESLI